MVRTRMPCRKFTITVKLPIKMVIYIIVVIYLVGGVNTTYGMVMPRYGHSHVRSVYCLGMDLVVLHTVPW